MLSRVSSATRSITRRPSTPAESQKRAISLAKVIFVAWKALQAYFTASASATGHRVHRGVEEVEELE